MTKSKMTLLIDLQDKLFGGKLAKLQTKFDKFEGRAGKKIDKLRMKYKGFVDEIPMLGRAMDLIKNPMALASVAAIGVGVAIGSIASKGVAAAEKFDTAFLPIKQLNLDKPQAEMEAYRSKIRDAAFDIGTNLAESTTAMYDLQSATGLYGDDAIEIFKKVGRYSMATGANLGDSMNSTTKAMKAFKLEVNQIDELLASNAKTVQTGIVSFDQLAKVQTEFAGATSAAGQSVDVGNKVFAMFTSISKNADIAANQTKTFFDGLGQQKSKIEQHLDIDVFSNGKMKEADKLLVEISKKFDTMNDQQITEAINKIGGPEGLRTALAKVKTGAEDMISTFDAFDSSSFSLEQALANAEGDFGKMKEIFGNRLEAIFTKIGEKIIPMLVGLFDKLNPVLEWLYNNIDWILPAFGTFVTVLGVATGAMWLFNAAVSANPISLIIIAVAALIALVVVAINKFDSWGSSLLVFMGPIGLLISAVMHLKTHWDSVVEAFKSDGIVGGFKRIGEVLLDVIMHPLQRILGWVAELTGWDWASQAQQDVIDFRNKLNLVSEDEKNKESEESEGKKGKSSNPFGATTGSPFGSDGTPNTTNQNPLKEGISRVTGSSSNQKNIKINLEALHKGDIVVDKDEFQGMSMEDIETWFNNMMLKVLRNVELS